MSSESNKQYFIQQEKLAAEKYMSADGDEAKTEAEKAALKKTQDEIAGKIFRQRLLSVVLIGGLAYLLIKITE